jgi:hypothetical protein
MFPGMNPSRHESLGVLSSMELFSLVIFVGPRCDNSCLQILAKETIANSNCLYPSVPLASRLFSQESFTSHETMGPR